MKSTKQNIAALLLLILAGFFFLPVAHSHAQINCEIVKWPRTDADKFYNPRFGPTQPCTNFVPPGGEWPQGETPQPSVKAGADGRPIIFECERRGCFQHFNLKPVNAPAGDPPPDFGLTCVYFPCQPPANMQPENPNSPGVAIICDKRGCNSTDPNRPKNGAAETSMGPVSPCKGCAQSQCDEAERILMENHENYERAIMSSISEEMRKHRIWLREVFLKSEVYKALIMFTNQMSTVGMQQMMMIGQFLDAKQVMETWRTFQYLQHQAHRDYTPSRDFCWFGTNVRSLAASEDKTITNTAGFAKLQLDRHVGKPSTAGARGKAYDLAARWNRFKTDYCDPKDNRWTRPDTGLSLACDRETPGKKEFVNIDIDYTRLIERPHTLQEFDLKDGLNTDQEKAIFALSQNLYGHNILTRNADLRSLGKKSNQYLYHSLRSIAAKRSVAEHSFDSIIGLKSKGSDDMTKLPDTSSFLYALLKELGMKDEDIKKTIGENPSYYAQLEILTKNIYQNPDFYANLYDTPVNVQRKSVALRAIERMLDQAILESQIRQEMSMAVLMSSKLRKQDRAAAREIAGTE